MSRVDPSFAYAQARLQARYGSRPAAADWSHVEAIADLGALLQVLRGTTLARWTARVGPRPGVHEVERRLREEWLAAVDEVAAWQPEPWRGAVGWLRWLAYLPSLEKLARGGRPPAWMRQDPLIGPVVAIEPRDRLAALRKTPLAPLAAGFAPGRDVASTWAKHWQRLWPASHPGRPALLALLRVTASQRALLAQLPPGAHSRDALRGLERRFQLSFRRNPLSPAASVAYLGLLALDARRVRGALAKASLREQAVAA